MIVIGRHVNGVILNGLEYLHTEDGELAVFGSEEEARQFLTRHGVPAANQDAFEFTEVSGEELDEAGESWKRV